MQSLALSLPYDQPRGKRLLLGSEMLKLTRNNDGPRTTIFAEGELGSTWVQILERECQSELQSGSRVTLDLARVTFVDQAGLHCLRALASEQLTIVNANPLIDDLFRNGTEI